MRSSAGCGVQTVFRPLLMVADRQLSQRPLSVLLAAAGRNGSPVSRHTTLKPWEEIRPVSGPPRKPAAEDGDDRAYDALPLAMTGLLGLGVALKASKLDALKGPGALQCDEVE
mmetsp:Transcript_93526/g.209367  ORF Transcript_93526/g.209367 Transcript_93526/m.209367 type:complete len:113 (-) Transcript_93526:209-547(-)